MRVLPMSCTRVVLQLAIAVCLGAWLCTFSSMCFAAATQAVPAWAKVGNSIADVRQGYDMAQRESICSIYSTLYCNLPFCVT